MNEQNGTILSVNDLKTYFMTEDGVVKAVDGISFELKKGETLGIVGESGSGKSVTNLSVMRLIPEPPGKIAGGKIVFDGIDVLGLSIDEVRKIRGKRIAMIFQDPMTSLNPFLKISTQLMEVTRLHLGHDKQQAREHAVKMMKMVGISDAEESRRAGQGQGEPDHGEGHQAVEEAVHQNGHFIVSLACGRREVRQPVRLDDV